VVTGPRTYDDPCGIARALDLIGERWALLVVRELALGPKRFTDLRSGLPGASPNVLAQRLRELEQAAIVRRRHLGPPASAWVYELTRWGLDLEPVLVALGRWGSRSPARPAGPMSADALILALETTFAPANAGNLRARYELRLGEDRFGLQVGDGQFGVARGALERPDASLTTDVATLRALVFGGAPLSEAIRTGTAQVSGDELALERLLGVFPRPEPVA
jgi:DNA-binding HxlR family transcriptional regulator